MDNAKLLYECNGGMTGMYNLLLQFNEARGIVLNCMFTHTHTHTHIFIHLFIDIGTDVM